MSTTLTPNMSLPVPGVGTEPGPDYATDVNNCLTIVDSHDHTPGSGVPVTPSGININGDLAFNGQNAITLRSARFSSQVSPISNPADLGCLYESGVDLYFNDGSGNQIRITQSGGIAGTPGSIANLTPPASASYVAGNETFVWESAALTPANMDFASAILRNLTASSFGLTLAPPTLASDYQITLPQLPGSTLPVVMTSSGIQGTAQLSISQLDATAQARILTPPTTQKFLTGAGTYTLPSSPATPIYIRVRAIGGGGGGSGSNAPNGGAGGTTTFGTSLITCTGGGGAANGSSGGSTGGQGGSGGTATATGLNGIVVDGAKGSGGSGSSSTFTAGGSGGSGPLGGAGGAGSGTQAGSSAATNSGAGGGGSGQGNSGSGSGAGGGSGGYVDVIIPGPASSYAYAVGAAGTAGSGGGSGGEGIIIVDEYYG